MWRGTVQGLADPLQESLIRLESDIKIIHSYNGMHLDIMYVSINYILSNGLSNGSRGGGSGVL